MSESPRGSFGPFHLRTELGQGRFGRLYRGEEAATGVPVIIRTVRAPLDPAQREALLESLQWLCETPLDHPAIARPLACGLEGNTPFLVHTFVPGTSLDEFLKRQGPQPVDEMIVRLTPLAAAIDFAAAAGVHHGALDRRDVIVNAHHTALAGFGLAQAMVQAGVAVGARGPYHPPGAPAVMPSRPDDVYALAVVALQLLYGEADDSQVPAELLAVLQQAGMSPGLRAAFEAALAVDPARRPRTALGFPTALQAALAPSDDVDLTGDPDTMPAAEAASGEDEPLGGMSFREDRMASAASPLTLRFDTEDPSSGGTELPLLMDRTSGTSRAPQTSGRGRGPAMRFGAGATPAGAGWAWEPPAGEPPDFDALRAASADWQAPLRQTAQLPLELTLGPGSDEPRDGDMLNGVSDAGLPAPAQRPPAGSVAAGAGLSAFLSRFDAGSFRGPWIAAGALAVVGLIVVLAGMFLLDRAAGSVPFPRSAAPMQAGSDAAPPAVAREQVFAAPTVIPDPPQIQAPVPDQGPVPEPITEPMFDSPSDSRGGRMGGAAPPAPAEPVVRAPAEPARPAPSPPPAEAPPGRVLVRSTPAGAEVLVNGEPRGPTPLAVRELPLGSYTITVTHPSYGSQQERVTLTASVPARSVDFDLDRPAGAAPGAAAGVGALHIESRPAGAQVFINDRLVGSTPLLVSEVAAGAHVVRLELPGYRRWSTSVTVAAGARARVAASLEP